MFCPLSPAILSESTAIFVQIMVQISFKSSKNMVALFTHNGNMSASSIELGTEGIEKTPNSERWCGVAIKKYRYWEGADYVD